MSKKKIKTPRTAEKDPFDGISDGQRAFKMVSSRLAIRVGQRSPALKQVQEKMQASEPEMAAAYAQEGSKAINNIVLGGVGSLFQATGGQTSLAEFSVIAAALVGHSLVKAQEAGVKVTKQMIKEQVELFEGGITEILEQVAKSKEIAKPKSRIILPGQ